MSKTVQATSRNGQQQDSSENTLVRPTEKAKSALTHLIGFYFIREVKTHLNSTTVDIIKTGKFFDYIGLTSKATVMDNPTRPLSIPSRPMTPNNAVKNIRKFPINSRRMPNHLNTVRENTHFSTQNKTNL